MRSKKEIRDLLAEGRLPEAAADALAYAEASGDTETYNGLIALNHDMNRHHETWLSGQLSFEESARVQARLTQHLLGRIDELPDAPNPAAARKRMSESKFKWLVFYLFLGCKVLVFGWTAFIWQVEGFTSEEAFTAFTALLPGLIVYAGIMYRHLFRSSLGEGPRRYVPARLRGLLWLFFPAYVLLQVFLVTQKAYGNMSFATMNLALLAVETGFGQFVGEVVEEVFKK